MTPVLGQCLVYSETCACSNSHLHVNLRIALAGSVVLDVFKEKLALPSRKLATLYLFN